MSLKRKLIVWVTILLAVLLAGNVCVYIINAKSYFSKQMSALSQDTATSLGLTISHVAKEGDIVQVESMINVIFDRGYYRAITYSDLNNKVLVSRAREIESAGVPKWFTQLVEIPAPSGSAEVVSGWFRLGSIHVVSHPSYVYLELWTAFVDLIWVFLFGVVLTYGVLGLALRGLFRPLSELESQAEAISAEDFVVLNATSTSPEFRRLSGAMNRMVLKIQALFQGQVELIEILRREVHIDPLTHLPNREEFDALVSSYIGDRGKGGASALLLCHVHHLSSLNHTLGRNLGDECVRSVANALRSIALIWPNSLVGRRSGADFCIFIPGLFDDDVDGFMDTVKTSIEKEPFFFDEIDHPLRYGLSLSDGDASLKQLLSSADEAMRTSQAQGKNFCSTMISCHEEPARSVNDWRPLLERAIFDKDIEFEYQQLHMVKPINTKDRQLETYEVFTRLKYENERIQASVFWPLLERFNLIEVMDRLVVEKAVHEVKACPGVCFSINLSVISCVSLSFRQYLAQALRDAGLGASSRLIFEVPEMVLSKALDEFRDLIERIQPYHSLICLTHFGLVPSSLGHLQVLGLNCVKIDRRFVQDIHLHQANRFYVKILIQIAHSFSLKIYADGVECDEDKEILIRLGINGVQGFCMSTHHPIESLSAVG